MLKLFISLFALGAITKVKADVNFTELCLEKAPHPDDAGFVCLSELSVQYLRCHLPEKVAFMMECANGTVCSYAVGEWTVDNPCRKKINHHLKLFLIFSIICI